MSAAIVEGYLRFTETDPPRPRKTLLVRVENNEDGSYLGVIAWYSPWRQYCFFAGDGCVFHRGCLETITSRIVKMMQARKALREGRAS